MTETEKIIAQRYGKPPKTNEEIIAEIIRQVPLASCGINLQEVAIQTAKAVLEYKDKELKEFLETNFVDIYNGARRRIISKKEVWIKELLKETNYD